MIKHKSIHMHTHPSTKLTHRCLTFVQLDFLQLDYVSTTALLNQLTYQKNLWAANTAIWIDGLNIILLGNYIDCVSPMWAESV